MRFCAGLPIWLGTSTQNDLPGGHGSCRRRCPRGGDLQGVEIQQAKGIAGGEPARCLNGIGRMRIWSTPPWISTSTIRPSGSGSSLTTSPRRALRRARTGSSAAMESFFSLLQKNVLDRQRWLTRQDLRLAITTWIERTYHRRDGNDGWENSRPSNMNNQPDRAHSGLRPRVNKSRGSPITEPAQ